VIAAVHAANRYETTSTILVPCDLTTTASTQYTIVESIRPTLILVATETDASIVQQQLDQTNESSSHVRNYRPDIPIWQATKPRIVNVLREWMIPFQNIVREQIQQHTSPHTVQHFQEQIHIYDPIHDTAPPERLSHIVFTSGTSGTPKGCCSSLQALQHYIQCKNQRHTIDATSYVALASPLPFDPCLGDILATWTAGATLVLLMASGQLSSWPVTHILCTPTWWNHYGWSNATWKVIALGGEAIPPTMRSWTQLPLYATYGVTEACVYQTIGPIVGADKNHVGTPFPGMTLSIVSETNSWEFLPPTSVGEIVISGTLVDRLSGYWNDDDAANPKFIQHQQVYHYRTGDRGYFDSTTHDWVVMGRIQGQEGMVKYQGVRVELSEVERALLQAVGVVHDCIVLAQKDDEDTSTAHTLVAYLELEETCRRELLSHSEPAPALLCTSGPLLTLLHGCCQQGARVIPTVFVIVPRLPMSPTGKRTTVGLPKKWVPLDSPESQLHLSEYGFPVGHWLAESLQECLNLSHRRSVLTVAATFGTLGGDSLAATRVVRALYAHHASVDNTRFLGGDYGTLPGDAFAPVHLLRARSMGAYVDFLMSQGIGTDNKNNSPQEDSSTSKQEENTLLTSTPVNGNGNSSSDTIWYDALLQALQQGLCEIASALLHLGAPAQDPTIMTTTMPGKRPRLGKVSSRNERRKQFQSTPLHVACVKGRYSIVSSLIQKGARWNIPDASGLYPLHLVACSRHDNTTEEERWKCLECLLAAGAPLTIKDGNQQSLLHAATRAGHSLLLQQLLTLWRNTSLRGSSFQERLQWRDVWSRTAVHWAVLNGHFEALQVLLEAGCDPQPVLPHKQKRSSVALETPWEMNDRLYRHSNPELHHQMQRLLQEAMEKREKYREMNDRLYRHSNPELHHQMPRLLQEAMEKREKDREGNESSSKE
jgi:acyl-CoA synthetase (AMP-forming)/AMP-acid ligase II